MRITAAIANFRIAILSWPALTEIAGCGIEVGTHSHTHPELDRIPAHELAGQVRRPKAVVEDRLGVAVTSFAYPYGHYDRRGRGAGGAAGDGRAGPKESWGAPAADGRAPGCGAPNRAG